MTVPALLQPVAGLSRNPLLGVRPADMRLVPVGARIRDTAPPETGGLVCVYNGEYLLREHWDERLKPGDVVQWHDYPQGSGLRTVLLLVVAVLMWWNPLGWSAAGVAAFGLAASVAINLLIPIRQPTPDLGNAPGSVFSTSLAGNAARLDQAIWKVCGRVKLTPPFAAQPYFRYLPSDPANPTVDCDQYYYAIFAVGIGEHDIEKVFIGKTSIGHFQDVIRADYLPPGTQPTQALANVVTSDEVSGLALDVMGEYVGGYAACRPADKVTEVSVDIVAMQGLSVTVQWQVEVREINNFGAPLSDWQILATEERTADTNTPQRWTNDYTLSAPIRAEVRIARINEKDTDPTKRDGIQWTGLRATLLRAAPLNPETAHYEIVMRASEQLSNISQRDFSIIARGKVRKWNGSTWSAPVFSRNAADWLAELWTSEVWGEGYSDDRVDLQSLYEWGQTLDARQDHFDYVFAAGVDAWEAAQLIARSGRARAFVRNGVRTIVRDELVDLPVAALTARNTQPKSMAIHATLPKREAADGVIVEYQSNVTWDTATIECPCPGYSVSDPEDSRFDPDLPAMEKPVYIRLDGVTGAFHAEREGLYQAANMALRQATVNCTVEMEGMMVSFMDPVRWQPRLVGYGQAGDVAFWDAGTLVMGLSEPPAWDDDPLYLTLQRDDMTLTDPVEVTPGPTAWDVTLPAAPDFDLVLDDGTRERPKFILGKATGGDELVKITAIEDGGQTEGGAQLYSITALIDDDRVHEADNHLLPGPGDIQDPIDDGGDVASDRGGGSATLVSLHDHSVFGGAIGDPAGKSAFTLFADGTAGYSTVGDYYGGTVPTSGAYAREWLSNSPVEPETAAAFECYADDAGAFAFLTSQGAVCSGTIGSWLSLDTDRTWSITAAGAVDLTYTDQATAILTIKIRRAGTSIVQTNRNIVLGVKVAVVPAS